MTRRLSGSESSQQNSANADLPPVPPSGVRNLAALALLHAPKLLDRILCDFERCGVVGEQTNPGIRSFEVYCYEKVIDGFWHLRSVNFLNVSDSMRVQVVQADGAVKLFHDGVPQFTVHSALRQVLEQTKSRKVRGGEAETNSSLQYE